MSTALASEAQRPLTEYVAEEIRALMGRRDISKTELARRLGVSDMWVGRRLRGQLPIDLNDLARIAPILGVGVTDLLPRTNAWYPVRDPLEPRVVAVIGEPKGPAKPRRAVRLPRPTAPSLIRPASLVAR